MSSILLKKIKVAIYRGSGFIKLWCKTIIPLFNKLNLLRMQTVIILLSSKLVLFQSVQVYVYDNSVQQNIQKTIEVVRER